MALEFICSNDIESDERIIIPRDANCYRLKSGKIKFYHFNPSAKNIKFIPDNVKYISFSMEINAYNIEYGGPKLYDSKSQVLKIGVDS